MMVDVDFSPRRGSVVVARRGATGSCRLSIRNPRLKPRDIVGRPHGTLESVFVRETRVILGAIGNRSSASNLLERSSSFPLFASVGFRLPPGKKPTEGTESNEE